MLQSSTLSGRGRYLRPRLRPKHLDRFAQCAIAFMMVFQLFVLAHEPRIVGLLGYRGDSRVERERLMCGGMPCVVHEATVLVHVFCVLLRIFM